MAGYENLSDLLLREVKQKKEAGCQFEAEKFKQKINDNQENETELMNIYNELAALQVSNDFPYTEPSQLADIKQETPEEKATLHYNPTERELYDQMYGAWLGRCIGCALGKPLETSQFMFGPEQRLSVKRYLEGADAYPLDDYVPESSTAEGLAVQLTVSTREKISYMESDDDIRYTLLGLEVIKEHGIDFTTEDVAEIWLKKLPFDQVYTAEAQAYLNLLNTEGTPRRGNFEQVDWEWTATYLNPYREWIGAQIRADYFGYIVPGKPELAAELAWRDARLSHVKNGIYGEMFFASVIAAAFVESDPEKLLKIGLRQIPAASRLAEAVKDIIEMANKYETWEECYEAMMNQYGDYSAVHTINNALIVAIGLLYGGGDFEKGVTIAVMCGLDTDCNGATIGSIVGAIAGAHRIPRKWVKPLHDTIDSELIGVGKVRISDVAAQSVELCKENNKNLLNN